MNNLDSNPFQDPRAADSLNGIAYVKCFSPYLVDYLPEVFVESNVILRGTQGCGKSMILKLFDPKVRIAYHELGVDFPIKPPFCNFLSAGVNLSRSGLLDIIQRLPKRLAEEDDTIARFVAIFCDYLNYWLFSDLLNSIALCIKESTCFGAIIDESKEEEFVKSLVEEPCWFSFLKGCKTLADIRLKVDERILNYRKWANWNTETLDDEIQSTKTVIGEPLASAAACLRGSGMLREDALVFVRIDQMEELRHRDGEQALLADHLRRSIYLALGRRDSRVSYRLGTRSYDARGEIQEMPGGRILEESRDYVEVDFDSRLRRQENRKNWPFQGFAEDVFSRRISVSFDDEISKEFSIKKFLGPSPTPQEQVEALIVNPPSDLSLLMRYKDFSKEWRYYIESIYKKKTPLSEDVSERYPRDPLNALLMVAWARQNGGKRGKPPRHETENPPKLEDVAPWTKWWEKERKRTAVMLLIVRHKQRLFWWGADHVLSLSASNITLFLSICRETWDLWRRDLRSYSDRKTSDLSQAVPSNIQSVAIDDVSKRWHQNFSRQPGRPGGDVRIRFVDGIAGRLREMFREDEPMRYPGQNGFSVLVSDLDERPELKQLLEEASAWGDLYRVRHTSKISTEKNRDPRYKYYINQILCPYYQIVDIHTKEPAYMAVGEILKVAQKAKALPDGLIIEKSSSSDQLKLPFNRD